ncbi:DUF1573 domain-containing protein [Fluviicola taffensis]|uniref:DUF1573 domain-containing protein n=1 Tax=Fluviicola taffensis (strain DSM 16823 / NCIMB 13979 / RW262) TaxID=755732 RepID=F2ICD9_FLUTR|nr:DUF1573 domain-containing protein [Fluviicola taffensis]AEA45409.1 protein of unknown function DUF1573 [Fluviicola taffensis DSM 16823]
MKRILFLGLALSLLSACGSDSPSEVVGYKTTMKIQPVYNAGKVARGEVIQANFVVENTGEYPLVLSDVTPSCSCTISDWSKDPIPPGEKGFVKANVNTEALSAGLVTKGVTILSNTTPARTKVVIQATVIK